MIQTIEKIYLLNKFLSYKLTFTDGRIYSVPLDKDNTEYKIIQEWIAKGGVVIDNGGI
jgi:hypothetical protein